MLHIFLQRVSQKKKESETLEKRGQRFRVRSRFTVFLDDSDDDDLTEKTNIPP